MVVAVRVITTRTGRVKVGYEAGSLPGVCECQTGLVTPGVAAA